MFLNFTKSAESWTAARDKCCEIGLTLASMESAGKLNCFSKLINKGNGDFWLSGTDQGCPSKFRWCSRDRDFVSPEIKWKVGHPKAGLACVYLEVRNGTSLLATADCAEQKNPLCEIRKKATPNVAMEMECAEIWNVPLEQIDLLFNVTAFLAASVSRNLMCFIKCVGSEMGLFDFGKAMSMEVLRQIELVAQESPVLLEQAMAAFLQCSAIKLNDDCTTAYEMYKCCQQKVPSVVSAIIIRNYDNRSISSPPIGCVPARRRCWLSENYPCEVDNPVEIYKKCCSLGMKLMEPETKEDYMLISTFFSNYVSSPVFVGETEFINATHEVWCNSRAILQDTFYGVASVRYSCEESIILLESSRHILVSSSKLNLADNYMNPQKYGYIPKYVFGYVCVKNP
ncbi:uncharacterized protein LOC135948050 isoform X2 [Cloeon dipterum]|uniref:uncharacterized protein LOC135948050 isoform X2 n=1 Tax=Cloeon dipterum TaxID=197152 RepID=UPI00322045F9